MPTVVPRPARRVFALWALALGCKENQPPAPAEPAQTDPVVEGASQAEAEEVLAAWRDFGREVVLPRPQIDRVVVMDDLPVRGGVASGRYVHESREIKVARKWDIRRVVFHEMCHALDLQSRLATWDRTDFPVSDDFSWAATSPETQRMEAFAGVCELQADAVAMLGAVIDGCDGAGFGVVVRFLNQEVFRQSSFAFDVSRPATVVTGHAAFSETYYFGRFLGLEESGTDAIFRAFNEGDPYGYYLRMDLASGILGEPMGERQALAADELTPLPEGEDDPGLPRTIVVGEGRSYQTLSGNQVSVANFDLPGQSNFIETLVSVGSVPTIARDACASGVTLEVVSSGGRLVAGGAKGADAVVIDYADGIP